MEASTTPDALWQNDAVRVLRPAAVACRRLRRRVGRRYLLDGVSLRVAPGARVLVVSRPEASASLLLRVLAGLARVDRGGEVELAGIADRSPDPWGRRVAYLGPEPGVHRWMTPRETLELAARLSGLGGTDAGRAISAAAGAAGLADAEMRRPIARGRLPMLQRVGFAAALIGDPEVLLLDEPLRALDPAERTGLLRLPGRRLTVLLASRYPASEAGLCTHVAYLRQGRLALMTRMERLSGEGLPLSLAGIEELSGRLAAGRTR